MIPSGIKVTHLQVARRLDGFQEKLFSDQIVASIDLICSFFPLFSKYILLCTNISEITIMH